jgi:hypothetical protein
MISIVLQLFLFQEKAGASYGFIEVKVYFENSSFLMVILAYCANDDILLYLATRNINNNTVLFKQLHIHL